MTETCIWVVLKSMLAVCLVVALIFQTAGTMMEPWFWHTYRNLSPGTSISSAHQGDKSTTWGSSKTCDVFAWMLAKKMVQKEQSHTVAISSPILMMDILLWQYVNDIVELWHVMCPYLVYIDSMYRCMCKSRTSHPKHVTSATRSMAQDANKICTVESYNQHVFLCWKSGFGWKTCMWKRHMALVNLFLIEAQNFGGFGNLSQSELFWGLSQYHPWN